MTSLEAAIEELYKTFAAYPLRAEVEGCPCCVTEAHQQQIMGKPLRKLEGNDLDHYAFKAMTTWGTTDDFKHFLPRILDLMSRNALLTDIFVVLGKLSDGGWHDWPHPEQQAVKDFLYAWWKEQEGDAYLVREAFMEIYKVTGDIDALLNSWESEPRYLKALVDLILDDLTNIVEQKQDFRDFSGSDSRKLLNWIHGRKSKLESAFFQLETADPSFAKDISNAVYILDTANNDGL